MVYSLGLNFSPLLRQNQCPINYKLFPAQLSSGIVSSNPLRSYFLQLWVISLTYVLIYPQMKI